MTAHPARCIPPASLATDHSARSLEGLSVHSSETIIGWRERTESVTDDVVYPSIDLILDLHEQIVEEGDATEPGVRSEGTNGTKQPRPTRNVNEIALEMGELDGRRHAEIYAALEDE